MSHPVRVPSFALKQCRCSEDVWRCGASRRFQSTLFVTHNGLEYCETRQLFSGLLNVFIELFTGKTHILYLFDRVPPKIVLIAAFFFFFSRISVLGEQTYTYIIRWIAAVSVTLINPRPAPRNGCVLVSFKALQSDVWS